MKISYILLLFVFYGNFYSQKKDQIISLKPEALLHKINKNKKPVIIQFWNPNCEDVNNILKEYQFLENRYANVIDFYFIGVTDKKSLVFKDLKKAHYNYKIYIIDINYEKNINKRKEKFTKKMSKILKINNNDFITLVFDRNHKVIYHGDLLKIEPSKFKEIAICN